MTLIKSISGIRGTIGGTVGDNLTPQDIVECTAAFGSWILEKSGIPQVVIGRDARISGDIVNNLVVNTMRMMGINVIDLGLATTPTVEMAVPGLGAGAGIVITASHNPKQWNALKFLNHAGEFISASDGADILSRIGTDKINYSNVDKLGTYELNDNWLERHINAIFALEYVDLDLVRERQFKVVVDAINSVGGVAVPVLLGKMGCEVIVLNGECDGKFAHNPEPLPEHLSDLSKSVLSNRADIGIAVDPDVDRLALVCEDGEMFGEEYTLVAVADFILSQRPGNTVSNLSSTRALRDITLRRGGKYTAAAVGEVNVVEKMKATNAIIGGEGNGGIILPELHYGRDALVGIAIMLTSLARFGKPLSFLRATFPNYFISKNKIELSPELDMDAILPAVKAHYTNSYQKDLDSGKVTINTEDGLKIDFENDWVHLRKSNTEPIIRIYAESNSDVTANTLVKKIKSDIQLIVKK